MKLKKDTTENNEVTSHKCNCCQSVENSDKYGLQYAYCPLTEEQGIIISIEEVAYLDNEKESPEYVTLNKDKETYITIAYGIFRSQSQMYEDLYDLSLSKNSLHYYLDEKANKLIEVEVVDYAVFGKKNSEAKVVILVKSNEPITFPRDQTEYAVTLSRMVPILEKAVDSLLLSRIEYGIFRLDKGYQIDREDIENWQNDIDTRKIFPVKYERLLLITSE